MVFSNDPEYEKRKANEQKLKQAQLAEDLQKEQIIAQMRQESISVLCLALMYAKNFEETGDDVTRRLITAEKNLDVLERMYKRGVDDTIQRIKKGELKIEK